MAPVLKFQYQIVKLGFQEWDVLHYSRVVNYIDNHMMRTCEA
jgi:hypothetical protein